MKCAEQIPLAIKKDEPNRSEGAHLFRWSLIPSVSHGNPTVALRAAHNPYDVPIFAASRKQLGTGVTIVKKKITFQEPFSGVLRLYFSGPELCLARAACTANHRT